MQKIIILFLLWITFMNATLLDKAYKLYEKAVEAYNSGNYQLAIDYYQQELKIEIDLYGKQHIETSITYNNLALAYQDLDEYNLSLKYHTKALKITEKELGTDNIEVATIYSNVASIYQLMGSYKDAMFYIQKSLKIREKKLDSNNTDIANTYNNIASLYQDFGEYNKSLIYYKKALLIREEILGERDTDTLDSYNNIATLYQEMGDTKNAFFYNIKVISIGKEVWGKDHVYMADPYNNLALLYQNTGKYNQALEYYQKAIEIREEKLGLDHTETATSYGNIALFYQEIGDYKQSLFYHKKAIEIFENELGKKHIYTATTYNNISLLYQDIGDNKKALEYLLKSIQIKEEIVGKDNITIVDNYNNLALTYYYMKDYEKSLKYYIKSINIQENNTLIDEKVISTSYSGIAILYQDMNNYEKALEYYQKSIKLLETNTKEKSMPLSISYNNIAVFYDTIGSHDNALLFYKKALSIEEIILAPDNIGLGHTYNNIAISYFFLKKYDKAYFYMSKSISIYTNNRDNNLIILDNKQKQQYKNFNDNMDDFLRFSYQYITKSILKDKKEIIQKSNNYWLNFKGRVSEDANLISMIYEKADKETIEEIKYLRKLNIDKSNLYQDTKNDNTRQIKYIEEEISQIEIKLNENIKELNNLQNISDKNISKILKDDELYIDFAKTDNNYYIFTLDKSNHITFEELSEKHTKFLEQNIQKFKKNNKSKVTKNIKETQNTLSSIYDILAKYIDFKSKKSLIISPDGLLNFLPFEALYDGEKYLVESVNISYTPSGRELVRQYRREKTKNSSDDVVVFAHPDYDLTDKKEHPQDYATNRNWNKYLSPLKGSLEEIKILKKFYPKSKIYKDDNATVENLFKIKSPKILHISTHGKFVDDENITNPMQQTFLAFVDANLVPRDRDYRGIATALKLSSLSLNNTELVFLSACETGLGTVQTAEGVQGLPKAFIQAGAKNIIMSLWQVDDSKTTELTRYFYENINSGMGYKEALREAKLKMIKMHPYYWSGFVFSGLDI